MVKKKNTDDVFRIYRSAVKQYPILKFVVATKCVEYIHGFELAQHFYNLVNKTRLDFSRFIVTDTIIRNTFETGLVSDERKKGDVVGRKGILAADLRKKELMDDEDD